MKSPIKWHGGKYYLAAEIVARIPPHTLYVEPFGGSCAVLFSKPVGPEVVNDADGDLINFWRVLRSPDLFPEFARQMAFTPFSREIWNEASATLTEGEVIDRAVNFFAHVRQSFSGMRKSFASVNCHRPRRGIQEQVSAWLSAVEGLPEAHERLRNVVFEHDTAIAVIERTDRPDTFFYLDPPYLADTRTSPDVYAHEMNEADHRHLLTYLRTCKGKVLLSGYPSKLYDTALASWNREDFVLTKRSGHTDVKPDAIEVLWSNY